MHVGDSLPCVCRFHECHGRGFFRFGGTKDYHPSHLSRLRDSKNSKKPIGLAESDGFLSVKWYAYSKYPNSVGTPVTGVEVFLEFYPNLARWSFAYSLDIPRKESFSDMPKWSSIRILYSKEDQLLYRIDKKWIILEGATHSTTGEYPRIRMRIERVHLTDLVVTASCVVLRGANNAVQGKT